MSRFSVILQKLLLTLGERAAIIVLVIAASVLLFSESATAVYSQETPISFEKQESSWFQDAIFQTPEQEQTISYAASTSEITPTPSPSPTPVQVQTASDNDDVWERLADCESHKNWSINTGNGYYGGLQFSQGAWNSVGGSGLPSDASRDEQIMRGKMLQERRGWGPWGACSKKLGLN